MIDCCCSLFLLRQVSFLCVMILGKIVRISEIMSDVLTKVVGKCDNVTYLDPRVLRLVSHIFVLWTGIHI